MAMLAEPRRKQKVINLRAKNNAWSNDSSKFGQRMLEKMGWTSGKGLGANENGITEHVVARYKNDEKGLGFEDKNDQWIKHEDDFNALLANLSNANDNTENHHSGISLEDKSKKSKARIHYHKFTRGKDISRYSEKDLANIFGKKSFKNNEEAQISLKEDLKTTEQIFTEKGSMEDYFKLKLAEFKSKSKFQVPIINENDAEYDEPSYGFHGFSQGNDNTEFSNETDFIQEITSISTKPLENDVCNLGNFKNKKKKSKIHYNYETCGKDNENLTNTHEQQHQKDINKKFKGKKVKNKMQIVDNKEEVCEVQEYNEEKPKKKKSKSKQKLVENNAEESSPANTANGHEIFINSTYDTDQIYKKKKSKSKASKDLSPNIEINNVSVGQTNEKKSSKNKEHREEKKKSKRKNEQNVEDVLQNDMDVETLPKKKKKKKSKKNE